MSAINHDQSSIHTLPNRLRVLLVEDTIFIQKLHSTFLKKLGCKVELAIDGRSALNLIKNNYDLIFMDIGLPDINGIEVCKIIRQQGYRLTPIIALTAEDPEIKQQCFDAGMNDFLQKSISLPVLNQVLQRWFPKINSQKVYH